MKKITYFLAFVVTVVIFFVNISAYAQSQNNNHNGDQSKQNILPVISDQIVSDKFLLNNFNGKERKQENDRTLLAQNTQSVAQKEESDDLLDDFENSKQGNTIADPLYYFNYAMYSFNDILYFAALKPLAIGYKAITPTVVRTGVYNFFHNLLFPVRFVNNILQGKIGEAGNEVEIFLINSTIGVAGSMQVAQNEFDFQTSNEDLGQTLGSYSIGNGFYLVWPIIGPSSLRDTIGLVGDYFLTPVNYVDPEALQYGIKALDAVNSTSFRLGDYEALKKASFEPYIAIKDAYIQNRREKIRK